MAIGLGLCATISSRLPSALAAYFSIAAGGALLLLLEKHLPYRRHWRSTRDERRTDITYLVAVQVALPAALTLAVASILATALPPSGTHISIWPHRWPTGPQFVLMLLLADALRYLLHVAAHRFEPLWRLHAVHHAPAKLNLLNVGRFHPIERTLQYAAETLPFVILGVRPDVLALYTVFHSLHGFFQHANIDVRLGALNYLVSGPELHRWHHSRRTHESNANYSNHLALWDLIFGTYFRPAGREVEHLGILDDAYPTDFAAQLRAPFCRGLEHAPGLLLGWREIALNQLLRLRMALLHWRAWRPLEAAARSPRGTQIAVLQRILAQNRSTHFGREHGFDRIESVEDFRGRVPVQTYETLRPYIDEQERTGEPSLNADPPVLYAQTSGTTGAPRYFPLPRSALAQHRCNQELFAYIQYKFAPDAYDGRILAIVSPAIEGHLPSGKPYGAVSGYMYRCMPRLARAKYVIPPEVFELEDYDLKYELILRLALPEAGLTGMGTANPSTFLRLLAVLRDKASRLLADIERQDFSRCHELTEQVRAAVQPRLACIPTRAAALRQALSSPQVSFADVWPHLRLVTTWTGGSCGIALERLRTLLPAETRVVDLGYLASEFRGSITVNPVTNAGVATLQDNFFEFVEKESWESGHADFRMLDELEIGREYYIFVTTAAGLYRYHINDIIRVTGRFHATPTIAFVQKGKGVTSITGEKLYEGQVIEAMHACEVEAGNWCRFFVMLADVAATRYRLLIEYDAAFRPNAQRLAAVLDAQLCSRNIEYRAKRASGRLLPVEVIAMREGFAEAYRAWCVANGQREGQFKTLALQYHADFCFDHTAWTGLIAGQSE
jgi:sterol desaturase/sphingolipid hydroxylase (fatty acid hydroxylase superfamily)